MTSEERLKLSNLKPQNKLEPLFHFTEGVQCQELLLQKRKQKTLSFAAPTTYNISFILFQKFIC